jgi:DNA-binding transcriptional regulator YdaS (Cro superfamily)
LTFRKAHGKCGHDIPQSHPLMPTFLDFVTWAETQRRAAEMIGLSESMVSLILSGKRPLLPDHAIRAERASGGLYRADDLLPEIVFTRDEAGEVTGYEVRS